MRILVFIIYLMILTGCQKDELSSVVEKKEAVAPKTQEVSREEKEKIIRTITDRTNSVEFDKFKNVTFWTSKSGVDSDNTNMYFYLVESKDKPSLIFRVVYSYVDSDWIFFDRIQILADDEKVIDKTFTRDDKPSRTVVSTKVLELADIVITEKDARAFEKIAGSKSAVVRYSGKGQRDFVISDLEKRNFSKMVEMYDDSRKLDGLAPLGFARRTAANDNLWKIYASVYSKKEVTALKSKAKELGIDLSVGNIGTIAWLVTGPPREGYARASEDLQIMKDAGFENLEVTKHVVY